MGGSRPGQGRKGTTLLGSHEGDAVGRRRVRKSKRTEDLSSPPDLFSRVHPGCTHNLCLQVSMASATGSWCVTAAPLTYCITRPTTSSCSAEEPRDTG